jgi:hypothetical protein
MNEYVSALFANKVTASDAIDRLMEAGVELSEITVIVSPTWLGIASRSTGSINIIVGAASRAETGRRITVRHHGEVYVAGPLATAISIGDRRDRTRKTLDAILESFAPVDETLMDTLEGGAVVIALAPRATVRADAEQALLTTAATVPARRELAR